MLLTCKQLKKVTKYYYFNVAISLYVSNLVSHMEKSAISSVAFPACYRNFIAMVFSI